MSKLNLPAFLQSDERVLYVGAGGGFDVFSALPIVYEVGKANAILANISSTRDEFVVRESSLPADYPEGSLSDLGVWSIGRNGVQLVKKALEELRAATGYKRIVVVDGGVDSLMLGDEVGSGTYLEDFIVLAAVDEIECESKVLACIGFGTETEEGLNHYRALENMAGLAKDGHFLGSCSLTSAMDGFRWYSEECQRAWALGRKSHIQTKIISAVRGNFGDCQVFGEVDARVYGQEVGSEFISPLMGVYWFFDLGGVVRRNPLIPKLRSTRVFSDAVLVNRQNLKQSRTKEIIPL